MALLDIGTAVNIVVLAIIAIAVIYATVRWWRWHWQ